MKYYTGIGSRETPSHILDYIERIGYFLARKEFILRSGHAEGSDIHFEIGCDKTNGKKEIYLPWKGFEGSDSKLIVSDEYAFEFAKRYHPAWDKLSEGGKKLIARDGLQVLGKNLDLPFKTSEEDVFSDFIICWTKDGKGKGGTGQALRIAKAFDIPIFDLGNYNTIDEIKVNLKQFLSTWNLIN